MSTERLSLGRGQPNAINGSIAIHTNMKKVIAAILSASIRFPGRVCPHTIAGVGFLQETRWPKHSPLWLLAHTWRRLALIGVDEVGRHHKRVRVLASGFSEGRKVWDVVTLKDIKLVQDLALRL